MMEKLQEVEDSKPDKLLSKSYKVTSCKELEVLRSRHKSVFIYIN